MLKNMGYDILRQRLKEQREEKKLSRGQLAYKSGVSRVHIFNIEKGNRSKVGEDILARLARVLGTTPAYLMGQTNDPHEEAAGELNLPPDVAGIAERLAAMPLPVREVIVKLLNTALDLRPLLSEADHNRLFEALPPEERNRLESKLSAEAGEQPPADSPALTPARRRPVVRGSTGRIRRKRDGTDPQTP